MIIVPEERAVLGVGLAAAKVVDVRSVRIRGRRCQTQELTSNQNCDSFG